MINNNDVLKVITVNPFMYEWCLYHYASYEEYFDERIMPLDRIFKWHYTNECRSIIGTKYINDAIA